MVNLTAFKGVAMHQGDIVRITPDPKKMALPAGSQVAVIGQHSDGYLIVLLPSSLGHFGDEHHLLNIPPEHLLSLAVTEEAIEAVPRHSGNAQFQYQAIVNCHVAGIRYVGRVIAAIEGSVAASVGEIDPDTQGCADVGSLVLTGLAKHFNYVGVASVT